MFNSDEFNLEREESQFLYIQLYNYIRKKIESGKLSAHDKLPPIRELASKIGVNNVTVVNAYNLLEQDNYVYKKVGSGTYVQDMYTKNNFESLLDDEVLDNNESNNFVTHTKDDHFYNFADTAPTPDLFPIDDFKMVLNEVLDRDKGMAFTYQQIEGYFPLRKSINSYINKQGIDCNVENIQIVSGAQQAIDILSKALVEYGDIVFTESPTYSGALAVFKSRGAKIIEVPIEHDGIDLKVLENKLRSFKPKFLYIMPNLQNPTGYTYSKEKKEKILELAIKNDFIVVEDDYISELGFSDLENYSLKSIDKEERVIYIKSFSKIFMPGIRLAFMIIPMTLYNDVASAKHTSDISTSGLIQRAFELYLKKGLWEKHIAYLKNIYNKKFNLMTQSLERHMPKEVTYHVPKGGLSFWFSIPPGYSADELQKRCIRDGILIVPGSIFYNNQKGREFFRLSIASIDEKNIDIGLKKLSSVIESYLKEANLNQNKSTMFNSYL